MMSDKDFASELIKRVQASILDQVSSKSEFMNFSHRGPKITIPEEFLKDCYAAIDKDKLKNRIIERLEDEVASKLVNKLMTECAADIKQIMWDANLREDLRVTLKSKIKAVRDLLAKEEG